MSKLEQKLERARIKQLERALQQERTGLQAIATAALEEARDPQALLHRLELMADNAVRLRKPQRLRDALVYGLDVYRRALERHELKEPRLFEIGTGPQQDVSVLQLARPSPRSGPVIDPSEDHRAVAEEEAEIRRRILSIYQFEGGKSDPALHESYVQRYGNISELRLQRQRKILTASGVVMNRGRAEKPDTYCWDLTERHPRFQQNGNPETEEQHAQSDRA